jgi:hypothetical protein
LLVARTAGHWSRPGASFSERKGNTDLAAQAKGATRRQEGRQAAEDWLKYGVDLLVLDNLSTLCGGRRALLKGAAALSVLVIDMQKTWWRTLAVRRVRHRLFVSASRHFPFLRPLAVQLKKAETPYRPVHDVARRGRSGAGCGAMLRKSQMFS